MGVFDHTPDDGLMCVPLENSEERLSANGKQLNAEEPARNGKSPSFTSVLLHESNRDVARVFGSFALALAVIPVVGLLLCEHVLRNRLPDDTSRWMVSGVVAVVLVNVVLIAYVLYCYFVEGFPEAAADKGKAAVS